MRVDYLCTYYSQHAHEQIEERTQELWDAYKFCGAVKNRSINGYCTVPLKKPTRINSTNVGAARVIFGAFIQHIYNKRDYGDAALVPAPSKDSFSTSDFRSRVMVEEACPTDLIVVPAVKFNTHLLPSSQGGPRGYAAMHPHMVVEPTCGARPVVLIDDIVTTGGTLLAARDRLVAAGFTVLGAIACGRTSEARETAFKPRHFEITHDRGELVDFD